MSLVGMYSIKSIESLAVFLELENKRILSGSKDKKCIVYSKNTLLIVVCFTSTIYLLCLSPEQLH
jgi:hypothetical protein